MSPFYIAIKPFLSYYILKELIQMGLFGNKNVKEVYDLDASMEDRFEISSEQVKNIISTLEQINKEVNEKYLEKAKTMQPEELRKLIDIIYKDIKFSAKSFGFTCKKNEFVHYEYDVIQEMAAKRSGVDLHSIEPTKIKPGKGNPNNYGTEACFKENIYKIALKDLCQIFLDSRVDKNKK